MNDDEVVRGIEGRHRYCRACHRGSMSPLMSFPVQKHPTERRFAACSSFIVRVAALRSANVAMTRPR